MRVRVLLGLVALLVAGLERTAHAACSDAQPLLVKNDLDAADAVLRDAERDARAQDLAACEELRAVVDAWRPRHGRPRSTPDTRRYFGPGDWDRELEAARGRLVEGAFADASARLRDLVGRAGDDVARARATSLRDLADAIAVADAAGAGRPPDEQPYAGDDAIPAGYHVERRTSTGLIVGGAAVFAVGYVPPALVLALVPGSTKDDDLIYVPVIGPAAYGFARGDSGLAAMGLAFSAVQAAGVTMVIFGIRGYRVLRRDGVAIGIAPLATATSSGMALGGTF